jgi:amino acid transporter
MAEATPAGTSASPGGGAGAGEKGLKGGALGLLATTVIGVASTAPGYSLAATLGFVIGVVGFKSPAIMWLAFIPMAFTAASYYYLNRADPDCGTTFSWVTRAMGPTTGWLGGWSIIVADIIVMAALAQIAGIYTFLLFNADGLADNTFWVTVIGCVFIVIVTWICYIGIEVSAKTQYFLLAMELVALSLFSFVALVRVYFGDVQGSVEPSLSWLNPVGIQGFELSWAELNPFSSTQSALVIGLLLAIFIYWGWDSAVTVNEESSDAAHTPGKAAIISTVVLVAIYLVVSIATQAFAGIDKLADQDDVLAVVGDQVLGSWLGKLLIIAVLTSATASCQTTILPTTRTALSMAAKGAVPKYFARIEPRYLTPSTATVWMGAISVIWYAGLTIVSEDALSDSLLSLGLMIAFYYALTAWACVWYYRHHLTTSWRNMVYIGIFPALGGLMLTWVLIKSTFVLWQPENSNSGSAWFGVGPPVVIAIGFTLIGIVLYGLQRAQGTDFFKRRAEVPSDEVARGEAIAEGALIVEED